jgi:arsenate reductase
LAKKYAGDDIEAYSAGTETKDRINQDAVRLIKLRYGIDMEIDQRSKLLGEIPRVDIVITMGCNVECPYLPCKFREDWGLDDPSGRDDETFNAVIDLIDMRVQELGRRIQNNEIKF